MIKFIPRQEIAAHFDKHDERLRNMREFLEMAIKPKPLVEVGVDITHEGNVRVNLGLLAIPEEEIKCDDVVELMLRTSPSDRHKLAWHLTSEQLVELQKKTNTLSHEVSLARTALKELNELKERQLSPYMDNFMLFDFESDDGDY